MSSDLTIPPSSPLLHPFVGGVNPREILPLEIWKTVFHFLKIDPHFFPMKGVGSVSRVCKDFLNFSRDIFPLYFLPITLARDPNLSKNTTAYLGKHEKMSFRSYFGTHPQNKLAVFITQDKGLQLILPQSSECVGSIVKINLKEALKGKVPDCYVEAYNALDIRDCHFFKNDCIIVCVGLVLFMRLDAKGEPEFYDFFYPFYDSSTNKHAHSESYCKQSGGSNFIQSSACLDGKLYLNYATKNKNGVSHGISFIDLDASSLSLSPSFDVTDLQGNGSSDLRLKNINGSLYHISHVVHVTSKIQNCMKKVKIENGKITFIEEISLEHMNVYGRWGIVKSVKPSEKSLRIFDFETQEFFTVSIENREHLSYIEYVIQNGFLIINSVAASCTVMIVYLPTRKNLTKLLSSHASISDQDRIIQISYVDGKDELEMELLIQNKDANVYLKNVFLNKNEDSKKPGLIAGPENDSSKPLSIQSTQNKVIFVAAGIFLLMTLTAFTTLSILKPGSIVYHGKGIILTVPNLATLAGGGFMTLLLLAIGSYKMWKNRTIPASV